MSNRRRRSRGRQPNTSPVIEKTPPDFGPPGPWCKAVTQHTLARKLPDQTVFENLRLSEQVRYPLAFNKYIAGNILVRAARVNLCTETEYIMAWQSSVGAGIGQKMYSEQNAGALTILSVPLPGFKRPYGVLESYIDIVAAGAVTMQDAEAVGSLRVPFHLEEASVVTNEQSGAKVHVFESPQLPAARRAAVMIAEGDKATDFTAFQTYNGELAGAEEAVALADLSLDGPNAEYLLHQSAYSPLDEGQRMQLAGYLAMARTIVHIPKGIPEGEVTF